MIITTSLALNENSLAGTPEDYRALARLIRAGQGTLPLDTDVEAGPDTEVLAQVAVRRTDAETVTMSVDREARTFTFAGPERLLAIVADTLDGASDVHDPKGHVHLDPFPGHYYLDEHSAQLIIQDARP